MGFPTGSHRSFPVQCGVIHSANLLQKHQSTILALMVFMCFESMIPFYVSAWTYYLQQDLGVQGLVHLCRYSNGKVYSFNATELCPVSIEDSAQGFGQGQGFLQGEYRDGMTKVCVYDVLGERKAVRLPNTTLCPLNPTF